MEVKLATAPTFEVLRPMKSATTPTFPVYADLPDKLVQVASHPDETAAHVMVTCAGYAYAEEQTLAMMMTRMGLEQNRCFKVAMAVDAMFICSTAYVLQ